MNEAKKVRDFLSQIKAPELQAVIQQVRATPSLSANFTEAANFITLSVLPIKQNQRSIGVISTQEMGRQCGRGSRKQQNRVNRGG